MPEQTGTQQESPIPGKMQNCGEFGTYIPALSTESAKAMCHGGWYDHDYYRACPVREECRSTTVTRARGLPIMNPQAPPTTARPAEPLFQVPQFRVPDFGRFATQLPRAKEATPQARMPPTPAYGATGTSPPNINWTEPSPSFHPRDGESTFERLFLNILQGVIAAIGWHIWRFCQTIDLFR